MNANIWDLPYVLPWLAAPVLILMIGLQLFDEVELFGDLNVLSEKDVDSLNRELASCRSKLDEVVAHGSE